MDWGEAKANLEIMARPGRGRPTWAKETIRAALQRLEEQQSRIETLVLSSEAARQRVEELEREKEESLIPAYEQEVKERRAAEAEVRRLEGLRADWERRGEALAQIAGMARFGPSGAVNEAVRLARAALEGGKP